MDIQTKTEAEIKEIIKELEDELQRRNKHGQSDEEEEQQVVNPWEVSSKGKIDYNKLIDNFGLQRLDQSFLDRVSKLTNREPHIFLRRKVFFAHRLLLLQPTRLELWCYQDWKS